MITDYTTLQTAVAAETQRRDLSAILPELIQIAEASIFRDLEARSLIATATGTTSGTIPMPDDLARIERIGLDVHGADFTLDYSPMIGHEGLTVSPGRARMFTVENGQIRLLPAPSDAATYTIYYIPRLTPLGSSNATNWLLQTSPDVYLYRTCMQVGIRTQDDALIQRHQQFYADALSSARRQAERKRLPFAGGLQVRPRGFR